jgi:hypothetical protein
MVKYAPPNVNCLNLPRVDIKSGKLVSLDWSGSGYAGSCLGQKLTLFRLRFADIVRRCFTRRV